MGIFDKLRNNKKRDNEEIMALGWDAITKKFEEIYPNQNNPMHYGTIIDWKFGGNDPLRGISIYDGGDCFHFVTYGLTELYEKESANKEVSGYGMEFTFRLKKDKYGDEEGELKCICGILQSIARITFVNGEVFRPYEYIYTGQTMGIDAYQKSNITGFITIPDVKADVINTPNGKVEFVEFIGVTDKELRAIMDKQITVRELYKKMGTDITDYNRDSFV